MELRERLKQAAESLADHPRRVVASAMGVFWGAAAIVLMLAWSTGFRDFMRTTFTHYGRGMVFVGPGITSSGFPGQRAGVRVRVPRREIEIVERENSDQIEAILAEHLSEQRLLVEAAGRVRRVDLTATDQRFPAYRNFRLRAGRFFDVGEMRRARAVAVLGSEIAGELFLDPSAALGRTLRIEGQPFELIGIFDEKSGRQNVNTNRPDNRILVVPASAAEERLGFDPEAVGRLSIIPRDGVSGGAALEAALQSLGPRIGVHPDDSDAMRWFDLTDILGGLDFMHIAFGLFIGLAGTITLLVGGVGIANYHLATLAEREVEIGVAKALGARNRTLVVQSVIESTLVSGGAALAGLALGLAGCLALEHLAPAGLFPVPVLSLGVVVTTLVALVGVGIVAALVPALRVRRVGVSVALRAGM